MECFNSMMKHKSERRPKNPYEQAGKSVEAKKGHVRVYVGEKGKTREERKRYEVPVEYFSLPAFKELLAQSQGGELDIKIDGPIELCCKTEFFDQLLSDAKERYPRRVC